MESTPDDQNPPMVEQPLMMVMIMSAILFATVDMYANGDMVNTT